MKKIWILTKTLYKNNSVLLENFKESDLKISRLIFVIICMLGCLWLFIGNQISIFYEKLEILKYEQLIINLLMVGITAIILISSVIYIISLLYFSKDVDILLNLPFKPYEIVVSKLLIVLFYEYILNSLFYIPILVVYGYMSSLGFLYYLYGSIIFLLLPIIPIVTCTLIITIIMRITNINKNKDVFKIIATIAIFIAFFIVNYLFKSAYNAFYNNSGLDIQFIMSNNINSIYMMHLKYSFNALIDSSNFHGLINIIIFIIINIIGIVMLILTSEKFYLMGVMGNSETKTKNKIMKDKILYKKIRKGSSFKTYALNEFRTIVRNPSYFIHCIVMNLIWTILTIIIFIVDSKTNNELTFIRNIHYNEENLKVALLLLLSFAFFQSRSNLSAFISISKYGQSFYFQKYLPISYSKQILAKVIVSSLIQGTTLIMNIIIAFYVFNLPKIIILFTLILSPLMIIYGSITATFKDIKNPNLKWTSEVDILKNNVNLVFTVIITFIEIGVFVGINNLFDCSFYEMFIIILILFSIADFLLIRSIKSRGKKYFEDILN